MHDPKHLGPDPPSLPDLPLCKQVTVTVVRCDNKDPISCFNAFDKFGNVGGGCDPLLGPDLTRLGNLFTIQCALPGYKFSVFSDGFISKEHILTTQDVANQFVEVCLDKDPRHFVVAGEAGRGVCFVLTSLGIVSESEFANVLRRFRDVLLGTPVGRTVVEYYYDEAVQKELMKRLKQPARALEVFRVLIEAVPVILEFVRPRSSLPGASYHCSCSTQTRLNPLLCERAVALLKSLLKDAENPRTRKALEFVCSLTEKSAGKLPGQILNLLVPEQRQTPKKRKKRK